MIRPDILLIELQGLEEKDQIWPKKIKQHFSFSLFSLAVAFSFDSILIGSVRQERRRKILISVSGYSGIKISLNRDDNRSIKKTIAKKRESRRVSSKQIIIIVRIRRKKIFLITAVAKHLFSLKFSFSTFRHHLLAICLYTGTLSPSLTSSIHPIRCVSRGRDGHLPSKWFASTAARPTQRGGGG